MSVKTIVMMAIVCLFAVEGWAQEGLQPVLPEERNWRSYPADLTGFTGVNRQQVAYWELKPAVRTRMTPGYKGTLVKLANDELLAYDYLSVLYRSTDEGRTWEREQELPDELRFGAESRLTCLRDGTVLARRSTSPYICRSTDGGHTWEKHQREIIRPVRGRSHEMYARDLIEQPDGSLLIFGSDGVFYPSTDTSPSTAWRLRSTDGGQTWPEYEEVSTWDSPKNPFWEAAILALSDTHFLAATRVQGDFIFAISGEMPPHGLDAPRGDEANNHMVLSESKDAGLHWSKPRPFLNYSQVHAHLLKLADGRILCSYANYHVPFGVAAVLSEDNGQTWDTAHPIQLGECSTCYSGYPTSVQVSDGSIVTAWGGAGFNVVRWQLPPPSEGYEGE